MFFWVGITLVFSYAGIYILNPDGSYWISAFCFFIFVIASIAFGIFEGRKRKIE